jgi:hypothetical protein
MTHICFSKRPTVCSICRGEKIRFLQMSVKFFLSNCNIQGDSLIKHFGLYERLPSNTMHLSSVVKRRAREAHDLPPSGVDVQSKPIWKKNWYVRCKIETMKRIISYNQQLEHGGSKIMWDRRNIAASWSEVFNLYTAVGIRKCIVFVKDFFV